MAYNTVATVRKNTLADYFATTGMTGSTINLNDNYTKSITEVKKNGVALSTGAYEFKPPYAISLDTALVSSDYVEVSRTILLTDSEVTEIIAEADNVVDSYLGRAYALPLSETPKVVQTKALQLARALVIKHLNFHTDFDVSDRELESANEKCNEIEKWFNDLIRGRYELVLADGSIVGRKDNIGEKSTSVYLDDSTVVS